jgi:hypothetical protein
VNKLLGTLQDLYQQLILNISEDASQKLRLLLEQKHLYQQVTIDGVALIDAWRERVKQIGNTTGDGAEHLERMPLSLSETGLRSVPRGDAPSEVLTLRVTPPRLFCSKCKTHESFEVVWFQDIVNDTRGPILPGARPPDPQDDGFQLFSITLRCQKCEGRLEGFIVRRDRWKMALHGRSPMENVEVPRYIPKDERGYFRDALIAVHGGKTLAGLFYLRVLIELFARRATGETGRRFGDDLMSEYYKGLPEAYRDLMPSLKEWYGKLSEAIHTGREDAGLFEEARSAIGKHFEKRQEFRIAEP